jgi:GMP synthase-like glutamine amidotransferase
MLVIIQNDVDVPSGAYGACLHEWGIPFSVFHPFAGQELPQLPEVIAVIVLGGAMGVHETDRHPFLAPLKRWIGDAVVRQIPFLGICLGGQLLADVCGATVHSPSSLREKGLLPITLTSAGESDPLFAHVPPTFLSFQWHNDSFELPAGAVHLASSSRCPNQAFRVGAAAWGTQFHPEMDRELVKSWAGWTEETASRLDFFLREFDNCRDAYRSPSRAILANFLRAAALADIKP